MISAFIREIETDTVHQLIFEKSCGALATFYGIKSRPILMKKFTEYVENRLNTDSKFYDTVFRCTNWLGIRKTWYNVFVYCVYGYDGKSGIEVEVFLNKCFPSVFKVREMYILQFLRLPIKKRIEYIQNNAVIVSFLRSTSGTAHWFNLTDIQVIEYETVDDEIKEESEIVYTIFDIVGMAKSTYDTSIITSFKDYLLSSGNEVKISETELINGGQVVMIIE